jgi:hypothetical protein
MCGRVRGFLSVSPSLLSTFYLAIVWRPGELGQRLEDSLRQQRDCHLENQIVRKIDRDRDRDRGTMGKDTTNEEEEERLNANKACSRHYALGQLEFANCFRTQAAIVQGRYYVQAC